MAVVAISGLSISRPLAVVVSSVAAIPITMTISMAISVSTAVVAISGLSISRPLAVVSVMSVGVRRSIAVSVSAVSVSMTIVAISGLGSGGGLGLSISGPLPVVVSSVA